MPKPMRSTSPRTSVMQFLRLQLGVPALRVGAAEGEEAGVRLAVERIEQLGLRERCAAKLVEQLPLERLGMRRRCARW